MRPLDAALACPGLVTLACSLRILHFEDHTGGAAADGNSVGLVLRNKRLLKCKNAKERKERDWLVQCSATMLQRLLQFGSNLHTDGVHPHAKAPGRGKSKTTLASAMSNRSEV